MAVKIRLKRMGKRDNPSYRIVVAEEHSKRDGKVIAYVGMYNPHNNPPLVKINEEEVKRWIGQGAKPTLAVEKLMKK